MVRPNQDCILDFTCGGDVSIPGNRSAKGEGHFRGDVIERFRWWLDLFSLKSRGEENCDVPPVVTWFVTPVFIDPNYRGKFRRTFGSCGRKPHECSKATVKRTVHGGPCSIHHPHASHFTFENMSCHSEPAPCEPLTTSSARLSPTPCGRDVNFLCGV